MSRPKSTIAEQLGSAELAITNSLADAEIQELVSAYGYNPEKLGEGRLLFEVARAAVSAQETAAGAQLEASNTLESARRAAFDAYQGLAKVARATFSPAALSGLGLQGEMPRGTSAFLTAAGTLFDNAPASPALADFGYSPERIADEKAKIEAFNQANQKQEIAKGVAQQATVEQDEALAALNKWAAQYLKIARVALRGKAQLLEKIGVAARTSPTAAQQSARGRRLDTAGV